MSRYLIAGIGELLWDILPDTEVLGGAPVNFSYHINALGAEGVPISTVGDDKRGKQALAVLARRGVSTTAITVDKQHPTGHVVATLDKVGAATYSFPDEVAWDHLQVNSYALQIQTKLDAVCFGTLAQRSQHTKDTLLKYVSGVCGKTLRVFDINLRQHFYSSEIIEGSLQLTDILKINSEELTVIKNIFGGGSDTATFLGRLIEDYELAMVILTRGEQGSMLVTSRDLSEHPGTISPVRDTIGAGDCYTAAATLGFLQGLSLDEINGKANELAAYVCSRQGAMPEIPKRLRMI